MQIEAGKYYWTRARDIVGPAIPYKQDMDHEYCWLLSDLTYWTDGRFLASDVDSPDDLISEVKPPFFRRILNALF